MLTKVAENSVLIVNNNAHSSQGYTLISQTSVTYFAFHELQLLGTNVLVVTSSGNAVITFKGPSVYANITFSSIMGDSSGVIRADTGATVEYMAPVVNQFGLGCNSTGLLLVNPNVRFLNTLLSIGGTLSSTQELIIDGGVLKLYPYGTTTINRIPGSYLIYLSVDKHTDTRLT